MTAPHHRQVRSFVLRSGRTTAAQKRALKDLMPRFGIPFQEHALDLHRTFGRKAPLVLDIGFGDGAALLTLAANHPDRDYLGIEVHEPGIGHLLLLLERAGLDNVRIIAHDAVEVLKQMLPAAQVEVVNLFFPDPWPKKRHHKRRIVQADFVRDVARILKPGGLFHVATDWADYAEHVAMAMAGCDRFEALPPRRTASGDRPDRRPDSPDRPDSDNASGDGHRAPHRATSEDRPDRLDRPTTKFERRGIALGHAVTDLRYRRVG